jgi:hypothetical protein
MMMIQIQIALEAVEIATNGVHPIFETSGICQLFLGLIAITTAPVLMPLATI